MIHFIAKNICLILLLGFVSCLLSSCDPATWEAIAAALEENQTNTTAPKSASGYTNTTGCSEFRMRKSYRVVARKTVNGQTIVKRYEARTENYLMYLVELDAGGRAIKRIDAGGEPLPDGLDFRAELRQEMDYVYGSDNRMQLEQQLKMVPLFFYCKPWTAQLFSS